MALLFETMTHLTFLEKHFFFEPLYNNTLKKYSNTVPAPLLATTFIQKKEFLALRLPYKKHIKNVF